MKTVVQTAPLVDLFGIDDAFRIIHESGFDGVDFNIDTELPGKNIINGEPSWLFSKSDDEILEFARPYKEAGEKYGVYFHQMHAPFPSYVVNETGNDIVMDAIKKCIMVCGYLGCKNIIVHPMFLGYDQKLSAQAEWDINIERYSQLIPMAKKYGVTVCLENMFTGYRGKIYAAVCAEMSEANKYINYLNSIAGEKVFGFCLDVGHALLVGKEIYSTIIELGDNLTTLHIHDNNGISDQHLFPYAGICDWDRFLKGLKDVGYTGALSFETFNGIHVVDNALAEPAMKWLGAIAKMFRERIEA